MKEGLENWTESFRITSVFRKIFIENKEVRQKKKQKKEEKKIVEDLLLYLNATHSPLFVSKLNKSVYKFSFKLNIILGDRKQTNKKIKSFRFF